MKSYKYLGLLLFLCSCSFKTKEQLNLELKITEVQLLIKQIECRRVVNNTLSEIALNSSVKDTLKLANNVPLLIKINRFCHELEE